MPEMLRHQNLGGADILSSDINGDTAASIAKTVS